MPRIKPNITFDHCQLPITEKEPRAPQAREAVATTLSGGCLPPTPLLRKMCFIVDLFLAGRADVFWGQVLSDLGSDVLELDSNITSHIICYLIIVTS